MGGGGGGGVIVFGNSSSTCLVYTTIILGQPAGLFKEACLNAGADWLKLTSVRERRELNRVLFLR